MPTALTIATALGCALSGGALFAFSSFVMPALRRLPAAQGIAAMQSINVLAVTPAFMTALFGSGALCIALAVAEPSALVLAAAATYLVGVLGVTMAYNVPRNNALAVLDPADPAAATAWERYVREWTAANHLRSLAGVAAAGLLCAGLAG